MEPIILAPSAGLGEMFSPAMEELTPEQKFERRVERPLTVQAC
jgi:hypothetical protein